MNNFFVFWDSLGYNRFFLVLLIVLFMWHIITIIYRSVVLIRSERKRAVSTGQGEGVSVIITCSNKAELLRQNLPAFLEQDYPLYEVIVVDECSEDETQDILFDFQQKYPHLKTSRIFPDTKFRRTKKIAINIGVLAAQHDVMLFSEIECIPESRNWVETMSSYFDPQTSVVIGFANYPAGKEKISLRRYFHFLWFWQTIVFAKRRIYVTGNGYNMGYRKKYYLEKRGFTGNTQEYIGYDTEMVRELSRKGKVRVVKEADARVVIDEVGPKAWKDDYSYFYASRRRWPWYIRLWSNQDFMVEFLLYILGFYFIFWVTLPNYTFVLLLLTFLVDFVIINICLKHLGQRKLFLTSLTVNTFGFLYKWYYSIYSIFMTKKWR